MQGLVVSPFYCVLAFSYYSHRKGIVLTMIDKFFYVNVLQEFAIQATPSSAIVYFNIATCF
jgi:hypothetical protein